MSGARLVDWLRRQALPPASEALVERERGPVETTLPGVRTLLEGLSRDEDHAVLDLGSANDSSLRVYGRFARRVRFVEMLPSGSGRRVGWSEALNTLPHQPQQPYDVLFAWNTLDRLFPEERSRLVERLAEFCAPEALLHLVVEMSDVSTIHAHRFSLVDVDRMQYDRSRPMRRGRAPLLPSDVERILEPFEVEYAFTLKAGFREYVARRRVRDRSPGEPGSVPRRAWRPE